MGSITIPNTNITYFMEDRLKGTLKNKIRPLLHEKDEDCVIAIDGGEGCQTAGDKVLMANGSWKNIEEIKIGDLVLSPQKDGSSKFAEVKKTFKWKCNEIYEVKQLNREKKSLYHCSYNHLIPIHKKISPRINGERKTEDCYWKIDHYTSRDYCKLGKKSSKKNQTALFSFPIENFMDQKNCEIEPYTLGAFLGDGHFSSKITYKKNKEECIRKDYVRTLKNGRIINVSGGRVNRNLKEYLKTIRRNLGITSADIEIIKEIEKHYNIIRENGKKDNKAKTYHFSLNSELSKQLSDIGLEGKGSGEKFIPKEALLSDLEYRKKLLAGLIDTDGYFEKKGNRFSIVTKSEKLAEGIYSLIKSLGGRGRIRKIKKGIKKLNFIGEYFEIGFYLGSFEIPTKLKRKNGIGSTFYLSPNRCSIDVIKTNKKEFVYGFTIDSESSWYITNDYALTHNTGKSTIAFQIARYLDPTFNIKRVVFNAETFREAILSAKKGQCVVFDEAFTGFSSRASLSGVNRTLVSLMMQMRQKNLLVLVVLPTFFLLDKYVALFRTNFLIHVYKNKGVKGYFRIYNKQKKKLLFLAGRQTYSYDVRIGKTKITSKFKGRFYGVFALGDKKVENKYREKKEKALNDSEKNPMSAGQLKYKEQRDKVLYLLRKQTKKSYQEINELLLDLDVDISFQQIRNVCVKFGDSEELDLKKEKLKLKRELEEEKKKLKEVELKKEEEEIQTPSNSLLQKETS